MANRLEQIIAEEEHKTERQIRKEYNDALQDAIRKSRDFFKRANDVRTGKVKPPSGLKTEKQVEGWKKAYVTRAMKQFAVVDKISGTMQNAGIKVRSRIQRTMVTIYDKSRKATAGILNKYVKADIPDMNRRQIEALLYGRGKQSSFSKIAYNRLGSGKNVADRLRKEMAVGIGKGESKVELLKRIMRVTGAEESDARRILRTESTQIQSMAQQSVMDEYYRKTGIKPKKTWHCIFQNSRDTHMDMDGQTVDCDQYFQSPSGAVLYYPGDNSAPPEEVINCQCYMEVSNT